MQIHQVGEKSYNIQNLLENYYGEIIIRNALNTNSSNKGLKTIISDDELSKILENFTFLKLKLPKIIEKTA